MTGGRARHEVFDDARIRAELTLQQLWLRYLGLGGRSDLFDIETFFFGVAVLSPTEENMLAHALNERLMELYLDVRVPYLPLIDPEQPVDPLEILTRLMDESVDVDPGTPIDRLDHPPDPTALD